MAPRPLVKTRQSPLKILPQEPTVVTQDIDFRPAVRLEGDMEVHDAMNACVASATPALFRGRTLEQAAAKAVSGGHGGSAVFLALCVDALCPPALRGRE